MIEGFNLGGDFHSRTAAEMFEDVRRAVDKGEVTVDDGQMSIPSVKSVFPRYRAQAKQLNFAIAYGAGAHSLKGDLNISQSEADEVIKRWYKARPEVLDWQRKEKEYVIRCGRSHTFYGRYR